MNPALPIFVGLTISIVPSLADSLRLEGEPFHPNASITWAVKNPLPQSMMIYRATNSSQSVLSNAMAIGSFKPINRIPQPDKSILLFQDKGKSMAHYLKICPAQGWANYNDGRAEGNPVHGVPTFSEAEKLAIYYLGRLGGDANQVTAKPKSQMEGTMTSFDKQGGRVTNEVIYTRGFILYRQIAGFQDTSSSFWINFGNDAKPSGFSLKWKNLQPYRPCQTASPGEILAWIREGRATVVPDVRTEQPVPDKAASLAVTEIIPRYALGVRRELSYPFADLEVTAAVGGTNTVTFHIRCPILKAKQESGGP